MPTTPLREKILFINKAVKAGHTYRNVPDDATTAKEPTSELDFLLHFSKNNVCDAM
ncbi:MAG: hypothetical protein LBP53_06200 [Candidatus Peribacteria bacterium]|jgi:hypothetical protein|nr:hypothetical protein [Candidatus Peribacteria bacterium]